jgi:nucleoside-diphosphate-sugar epimerase
VSADLAAAYAGRDVLVTGGLGFLGSHVARRLVALGARVAVLDALVPGYGGNPYNVVDLRERIQLAISDARDAGVAAEWVRGRAFVFNLAGQVSHADSMTDPQTDLENNCRASLSLLEACRREPSPPVVVFTSTRQVYGRPQRLPVDETHPCEPVDVNGIHKLAAESYHRLYHRVHGVPSVAIRLTNTYGPGQLVKHPRQGFMGWFLRQAVLGETIELMGGGGQTRDLNYVDDAVEALLLAGAAPAARGEVYNLGAEQPVSLREVAERMLAIAGKGSLREVPFPEERRRIDVGSVHTSFAKIQRDLGWCPRVGLDEGLRRSIRYYQANLRHYL